MKVREIMTSSGINALLLACVRDAESRRAALDGRQGAAVASARAGTGEPSSRAGDAAGMILGGSRKEARP